MLSARSDGAAISVMRYGDRSERVDQQTLQSLNASLLAMTSRGGGLVVASFGHHFNNQYASTGFVEGFFVKLRSHFERALVPLLRVLETFASSCRHCLAALVTPSLQHFETMDGTFDRSINLSLNGLRMPCRTKFICHQQLLSQLVACRGYGTAGKALRTTRTTDSVAYHHQRLVGPAPWDCGPKALRLEVYSE
jgi:hypothetical protein